MNYFSQSPPPSMLPQIFQCRMIFLNGGMMNFFSVKLQDGEEGFVFDEIFRNDQPVNRHRSRSAPVEGTMDGWGQSNAVGDGIIMAFTEGDDMAGIDKGDILKGLNPVAGDGTSVVI